MRRGVELVGLLLAVVAPGCASSPHHARYPSWEPTSPVVPAVQSRSTAIVHLETSRRLWSAMRAQSYSYVRAREQSDTEVEFTLVVVQQGRVVERALLRQDPGLSGLGKRFAGRDGGVPELLWRERGAQIGTHEAGAPFLTVDELYEVCRRDVLGSHDELVPRLHFQLNGLLQHCGFLVDDCPHCPVASLQSVGMSTLKTWQEPIDILCTDQHGLFVAEDQPHIKGSCEICRCRARNRDDPRVRLRAPAPPRPPSADELCSLLPEVCAEGASPPPLRDICEIDPSYCPRRDGKQPAMGTWECWHLLTFDCGPPLRPSPACIGRSNPAVLEQDWLRRCLPRANRR